MNKYNLLGPLMIIMAILFFALAVFSGNNWEEEKQVKCYDKFGNEIINQRCIQEERTVVKLEGVLFIALSALTFAVSLIFFGMGNDL